MTCSYIKGAGLHLNQMDFDKKSQKGRPSYQSQTLLIRLFTDGLIYFFINSFHSFARSNVLCILYNGILGTLYGDTD